MREQNHLFTMRELPETEQPYERCIKYGAGALTDAQLLAVILKSGTKEESALHLAQRILRGKDAKKLGIASLLAMQYPDYIKIHGIGPVKAVTLLCVVELAKRLSLCKKSRRLYLRILNQLRNIIWNICDNMTRSISCYCFWIVRTRLLKNWRLVLVQSMHRWHLQGRL